MRTIGVRELKTHLSRVLREVQEGHRVLITDRGTVVAELRQPDFAAPTSLSPEDQALAQMAADGLVRLAERPRMAYVASPIRSQPGLAQELIDAERDEE